MTVTLSLTMRAGETGATFLSAPLSSRPRLLSENWDDARASRPFSGMAVVRRFTCSKDTV